MAKKNQQPAVAAPSADASIEPSADSVAASDQQEQQEQGADAAGTSPDAPVAEDEVEQQDEEPGPTMPGLVLFDSVYGKCGEVKEFPASTAEAIEKAGYIDLHPNAIAGAEG